MRRHKSLGSLKSFLWHALQFSEASPLCFHTLSFSGLSVGSGCSLEAVRQQVFFLFWVPSVQFSRSVMSDSWQPHGLQHTRLPCPPLSPKVCSNSCPLNRWCHPTISSSVIPLFSCLQSFPTSESFLMSWLFKSGGQSIGASTSASVLSMNIQGWFSFRIDWFDLFAV